MMHMERTGQRRRRRSLVGLVTLRHRTTRLPRDVMPSQLVTKKVKAEGRTLGKGTCIRARKAFVQDRLTRDAATTSSFAMGVTKRRSTISRAHYWVWSMMAFPSDTAWNVPALPTRLRVCEPDLVVRSSSQRNVVIARRLEWRSGYT